MIVWLVSWLRGDPPDGPLSDQMRRLWRLPSDWTIPDSARVISSRRKLLTVEEWKQAYERKAS